MKRLRSRWLGPVRIDIFEVESLEDDGEECDGLFIPGGDRLGPSRILIRKGADREQVLRHEFYHAVDHYFGVLSEDADEIKVLVLEILGAQFGV